MIAPLEACEFFEIGEQEARDTIQGLAQTVSSSWRNALREVSVSCPLARSYERAVVHDKMKLILGL